MKTGINITISYNSETGTYQVTVWKKDVEILQSKEIKDGNQRIDFTDTSLPGAMFQFSYWLIKNS